MLLLLDKAAIATRWSAVTRNGQPRTLVEINTYITGRPRAKQCTTSFMYFELRTQTIAHATAPVGVLFLFLIREPNVIYGRCISGDGA